MSDKRKYSDRAEYLF